MYNASTYMPLSQIYLPPYTTGREAAISDLHEEKSLEGKQG